MAAVRLMTSVNWRVRIMELDSSIVKRAYRDKLKNRLYILFNLVVLLGLNLDYIGGYTQIAKLEFKLFCVETRFTTI